MEMASHIHDDKGCADGANGGAGVGQSAAGGESKTVAYSSSNLETPGNATFGFSGSVTGAHSSEHNTEGGIFGFKNSGVAYNMTYNSANAYATASHPQDIGLRVDDDGKESTFEKGSNFTENDVGHGYHHYYGRFGTQQTRQLDDLYEPDVLGHNLPTGQKGSNSESSNSIQDKILPSVMALAHRLLPSVAQRLHHNFNGEEKFGGHSFENDDFAGSCLPLGTNQYTDGSHGFSHTNGERLKTTGLDGSDYDYNSQQQPSYPYYSQQQQNENLHNNQLDISSSETQIYSTPKNSLHRRVISDLEMGDATEYLPQSAALLVSALQGASDRKLNKKDAYLGGSKDNSLVDLPSLINEQEHESGLGGVGRETLHRQRVNSSDIDVLEKKADALLDSIRRGDLDTSSVGNASGNELLESGRNPSLGNRTASFDDDDSMGGDMVRLSRSIAFLQRDLENVDFSYLDGVHDDGFGGIGDTDSYGADDNGLISRLRLWFSRGMIMEQKILNSYTSSIVSRGHADDIDGTSPNVRGGYMDNPVLIWSLALMWAFVLLISQVGRISDWVEGEDAGRLADVIEWMFGEGDKQGQLLEDVIERLLNA